MISSEAEAEQVARNLAAITSNQVRADSLLDRVKAERWRLFRNRRRLDESRALLARNAVLLAENARILGTGRSGTLTAAGPLVYDRASLAGTGTLIAIVETEGEQR